jgi:uncharacterized damage-inducible protein DinB
MTHYGGKDLARSFRTVRTNTIQTAEEIPENKYDFRATPDTRSVAETLAHIAISPFFQLHVHQNKITDLGAVNFMELFGPVMADEKKPRTKAELIALLKSEGDKYATYVESLPDAFLAEMVTMPPGSDHPAKSRLEMLLSPKEHEMHHRAQLMVVQRMIGLKPHLTRRFEERMAQMQAAGAAQGR